MMRDKTTFGDNMDIVRNKLVVVYDMRDFSYIRNIHKDVINNTVKIAVGTVATTAISSVFGLVIYSLSTVIASEFLRSKYQKVSEKCADAAQQMMINSLLIGVTFGTAHFVANLFVNDAFALSVIASICTITALPSIMPIVERPLEKLAELRPSSVINICVPENMFGGSSISRGIDRQSEQQLVNTLSNKQESHVQRLHLEVQGTELSFGI